MGFSPSFKPSTLWSTLLDIHRFVRPRPRWARARHVRVHPCARLRQPDHQRSQPRLPRLHGAFRSRCSGRRSARCFRRGALGTSRDSGYVKGLWVRQGTHGTSQGGRGGAGRVQVQLRTSDGSCMPGIEVGEIGPKLNPTSINIGYCRFTHVRIPKENLIRRTRP